MLEWDGVERAFGGHVAVRAATVRVAPGEFFSLLGPSGCGKTTLLRIAAGFESADRGRVRLEGVDVTGLGPHQRPCNMVFQRYALFPHLSVAENIGFGLRVRGVARAEAAQRVREALDLVALGGFDDRSVATLSGGQQQRVAIARAIVNRPKVLLLDEPLAALDLKLRQRMQVELLALQRRLGMTFVFVTHAQDEALALSDRIAVMRAGVVEQIGPPREIYENPATPFVAAFIGSMNRLAGRITAMKDGLAEIDLDGGGRLTGRPAGAAPPATVGARVQALIRPERLALGPVGAATGNHLPARVLRTLFRGTGSEVILESGGGAGAPVRELTVLLGGGTAAPAAGESVSVHYEPQAVLVMAADAGSDSGSGSGAGMEEPT